MQMENWPKFDLPEHAYSYIVIQVTKARPTREAMQVIHIKIQLECYYGYKFKSLSRQMINISRGTHWKNMCQQGLGAIL
jgi:hypothetical protein